VGTVCRYDLTPTRCNRLFDAEAPSRRSAFHDEPVDPRRRALLWLATIGLASSAISVTPIARALARIGAVFDVRSFGAVGDGKAVDSPAFNRAIAAAGAAGGGTVRIPAGTHACHSIRLESAVALLLEPGAIILAAAPPGYDATEPNAPWEAHQNFGHNHWHNSLIWGENVHDVALLGLGLIWGRGLGLSRGEQAEAGLPPANARGAGDKAIALKNCHNVILRDFSILAGGHCGLLATGVDNLAIDGLKIDTSRDGINIDCCRNVHLSNCSVNSPWDDGICLKSSFALGFVRATENVTISGCHVMGYRLGTMLDGSFRPLEGIDAWQPTGRIKLGTESNGAFKNITISGCTFESCRGFALESVDGGAVEDIIFFRHHDARHPQRAVVPAARSAPARSKRHHRRNNQARDYPRHHVLRARERYACDHQRHRWPSGRRCQHFQHLSCTAGRQFGRAERGRSTGAGKGLPRAQPLRSATSAGTFHASREGS
jgi:hypothetical protein